MNAPSSPIAAAPPSLCPNAPQRKQRFASRVDSVAPRCIANVMYIMDADENIVATVNSVLQANTFMTNKGVAHCSAAGVVLVDVFYAGGRMVSVLDM